MSKSSFSGGRFTADEAREFMNIKKERFDRTLYIIRQMCDMTMRDASRRGQHKVSFDVPSTVFGREGYDRHSMAKALASQLFDDGFDVSGTTSRIVISWGGCEDEQEGKEGRGQQEKAARWRPRKAKEEEEEEEKRGESKKKKNQQRVMKINIK